MNSKIYELQFTSEENNLPIEYIELTSKYDASQTSVDVEICDDEDGTIL